MEMNSLRNRLSNLAYDYSSQGNLGSNSKAEQVDSNDYMTLMGLAFTADLFSKTDNKEGVDLDSTPKQVRLTPDSLAKMDGKPTSAPSVPGEEIVGEYAIKETPKGKIVHAEAESLDAKGHVAWKLVMTPNNATIVALEDLGDTFKATAMQLGDDKTDSKCVRTGSWTELPDSLCFAGPTG